MQSRIPLSPGEQLKFQTGPHWVLFFPPIAFFILVLILGYSGSPGPLTLLSPLGILAALVWFVGALLDFLTSVYIVTSHRVYARWRYGLFWIKSGHLDIRLRQIESTSKGSTVLGTLLGLLGHGFGSVAVRGSGAAAVLIHKVFRPTEFKVALDEALRVMDDGDRQAHLTGQATATAMAGLQGGLTCPKCTALAPAGTSFCGTCGTKLTLECTNCSTPVTGAFCSKCGTPSATPA